VTHTLRAYPSDRTDESPLKSAPTSELHGPAWTVRALEMHEGMHDGEN